MNVVRLRNGMQRSAMMNRGDGSDSGDRLADPIEAVPAGCGDQPGGSRKQLDRYVAEFVGREAPERH